MQVDQKLVQEVIEKMRNTPAVDTRPPIHEEPAEDQEALFSAIMALAIFASNLPQNIKEAPLDYLDAQRLWACWQEYSELNKLFPALEGMSVEHIPAVLVANDIEVGLVSTMAYWQGHVPVVEDHLWERITPAGLAQCIRSGLVIDDWVRFVEEVWDGQEVL